MSDAMSSYEMCRALRRLVLLRAGEVVAYTNWSPEFVLEQMRGVPEWVAGIKWFVPPRLEELTAEQMDDLDFGRWSEDSPIRLIPLWLLPFLPDEIATVSIGGSEHTRRDEMDNDHRFGCLAYGVAPATSIDEQP